MEFKMQRAQLEDVEQVVELVESVYRGESSLKGWTSEAHLLGGQRVDAQIVRDLLDPPHSVILIYRENGKICGCVHLKNGAENVHLGMLSVDAHLQGKKLGQKIISFCEKYIFSEWQQRELCIEVLQQRTELIAWYERRGFKKTGVTIPFPTDPRFGVPKVKDLRFFEMKKTVGSNDDSSDLVSKSGVK